MESGCHCQQLLAMSMVFIQEYLKKNLIEKLKSKEYSDKRGADSNIVHVGLYGLGWSLWAEFFGLSKDIKDSRKMHQHFD